MVGVVMLVMAMVAVVVMLVMLCHGATLRDTLLRLQFYRRCLGSANLTPRSRERYPCRCTAPSSLSSRDSSRSMARCTSSAVSVRSRAWNETRYASERTPAPTCSPA